MIDSFTLHFSGGTEGGSPGEQGAGAQENGGQEGYGRQEKKGREAGPLQWREVGEKFKKASLRYLLLLTSSQRNKHNNVS